MNSPAAMNSPTDEYDSLKVSAYDQREFNRLNSIDAARNRIGKTE